MEIAGLPLHPLVVHAAVVLIPLTALLTIGLAVLPRWRWLLRWPTAAASLVCVGLAFLATTSGKSLEHARPELARLVRDPALCRTERGREVLARLRGLVLQPEDGERFAHAVPPHQLLETITILRASARSWIRLANTLQERSELPFQGQAPGRAEGDQQP